MAPTDAFGGKIGELPGVAPNCSARPSTRAASRASPAVLLPLRVNHSQRPVALSAVLLDFAAAHDCATRAGGGIALHNHFSLLHLCAGDEIPAVPNRTGAADAVAACASPEHPPDWSRVRSFVDALPTRRFWWQTASAGPQKYSTVIVLSASRGAPAFFYREALHALRKSLPQKILLLAVDPTRADARLLLREPGVTLHVPLGHDGNQTRDHFDSSALAALHAASRVIWGGLPSMRALMLLRRQPYEAAWTWCPNSADEHLHAQGPETCELLPQTVARVEVQMRSSSIGPAREAVLFAVRSSAGRGTWAPYSDMQRAGVVAEYNLTRGEWILPHACLIRGPAHAAALVQAHPITHELLWPLPWPESFVEYGWRFTDIDRGLWRGAADTPTSFVFNASLLRRPPNPCVFSNRTAFVTEAALDGNLFHLFIHAVPTFEFYSRLAFGRPPELLPHYLFHWTKSPTTTAWPLLAASLRSLDGMGSAGMPHTLQRAAQLLEPGTCSCFRRVVGGHAAFAPHTRPDPAQAIRVSRFRRAILAGLGLHDPSAHPAPPQPPRILFVLRKGSSRVIVNEDALRSAIALDDALAKHVDFIHFEGMSLVEQVRHIISSRALVGMHGQAMAWAMMLPTEDGRHCATVEIIGDWKSFQRDDYIRMSHVNGARYTLLRQPNDPNQPRRGCQFRDCGNVTVIPSQVVGVLRSTLTFISK